MYIGVGPMGWQHVHDMWVLDELIKTIQDLYQLQTHQLCIQYNHTNLIQIGTCTLIISSLIISKDMILYQSDKIGHIIHWTTCRYTWFFNIQKENESSQLCWPINIFRHLKVKSMLTCSNNYINIEKNRLGICLNWYDGPYKLRPFRFVWFSAYYKTEKTFCWIVTWVVSLKDLDSRDPILVKQKQEAILYATIFVCDLVNGVVMPMVAI